MACPRCGSSSYRTIGPGLVECVGIVEVPTGAHPSGVAGPDRQPFACGTRYQVANTAGAVPLCGCGMQSVGSCTQCGAPLCYDHVHRVGGKVLCAPDANALVRATIDSLDELRKRTKSLIGEVAEFHTTELESHSHEPPAPRSDRPAWMQTRFEPDDGSFSATAPSEPLEAAQVGGPCVAGKPGWRVESVEYGKKRLFHLPAVTKVTCAILVATVKFRCNEHEYQFTVQENGWVRPDWYPAYTALDDAPKHMTIWQWLDGREDLRKHNVTERMYLEQLTAALQERIAADRQQYSPHPGSESSGEEQPPTPST